MMKFDIKKFILPLICAVAAVLLAFVNMITEPKIRDYEASLTKEALLSVSEGYDFYDLVDVSDYQYVDYYYELKDSKSTVGYILGLKTSGYGGEITLVASFDTEGKIMAVKLLSNSETPGVGKRAENEGYMDMFIGKGSDGIPTKKDQLSSDQVAVVSGATLTFSGISRALVEGSDFVRAL